MIKESESGNLLVLTFNIKDILGIDATSEREDRIHNFQSFYDVLSQQSIILSSCMKFTSSIYHANECEKALNMIHNTVKGRLLSYFSFIEMKGQETQTDVNHSKISATFKEGERRNKKVSCLHVITALTGYLLLNGEDYEHAIQSFASSRNLVHESHISYCLLQLFIKEYKNISFCEQFNEISFIKYFHQIQPTIGIHAYRLMLELLRCEIKTKIRKEEKDNEINVLDSSPDDFDRLHIIVSRKTGRKIDSVQLSPM